MKSNSAPFLLVYALWVSAVSFNLNAVPDFFSLFEQAIAFIKTSLRIVGNACQYSDVMSPFYPLTADVIYPELFRMKVLTDNKNLTHASPSASLRKSPQYYLSEPKSLQFQIKSVDLKVSNNWLYNRYPS